MNLKCFNYRKTGYFKRECCSLLKEYKKKKNSYIIIVRQIVQLTIKEKILVKKEKAEPAESFKTIEKRIKLSAGFFDKLIE